MNLQGASVVLRADASPHLGTGHVMRMLTLADALREHGAHPRFVSRTGPGDLHQAIRARGYEVISLPAVPDGGEGADARQDQDAAQTRDVLTAGPGIDLLVVDHYDLGRRWHRALRDRVQRILVIDDLANREHDCDILLDQNLGHTSANYDGLVPATCARLCGPAHALLRPQFALARVHAVPRRADVHAVRRLLVGLGGADLPNATRAVLESVAQITSLRHLQIDVVLGAGAPWLDDVRAWASTAQLSVRIHAGVADMASLMAQSDLAVGAAGGSAWERCCVGLPTLLVVLAENQRSGAAALADAGAADVVGGVDQLSRLGPQLAALCSAPQRVHAMATAAAQVTDGLGTVRVVAQLQRS